MSKTIRVPHLGGIDVGYRLAKPIKQSKPTAVFITGLTNTVDSFAPQLNDESLSEPLNLIAIDALGNGQTNARATDTWTYWDAAIAALQAIDALGVRKTFVVGVSSGGWVAARMALYSPDVVLGLVLTGTSLDSENPTAWERGNMNDTEEQKSIIKSTSTESESFTPPENWGAALVKMSLGDAANDETTASWTEAVKKNYSGEAGRKRLRQTFINIHSRDSLHPRLSDIKAPVLWLHGDQDKVFSVQNAQEEIKLLTGSPDAKVEVLNGGHLTNLTNTQQFNEALGTFTAKYTDKPNARKLREAIGMVDI